MLARSAQAFRRKSKSAVVIAAVAALIVLVLGPVAHGRHADSVAVFSCNFNEKDWDINYDGWPDHWERKEGIEFPHYVNIGIQDDADVPGRKCLRFDLDGAAAAVTTPPIAVVSRYSYLFEAQLKNEELKHSTVVLTLDFCDASGRVVQSEKTEPLTTTSGWQNVRIGPVEPREPNIERAVLGVKVTRGAKGDLQGHVSIADLKVLRLPRIDVTTNNPCNVYTDRSGVTIVCGLSGIRERDPEIDFQLLDGSNRELQSEHFRLNGRLIVNKSRRSGPEEADAPEGYEGTLKWQPKIPDYGFYRVVVRMMSAEPGAGTSDDRELGGRTVDLVVVPPLEMPAHGEFGWTLGDSGDPLTFEELSSLLPEVGINWAKVPVWFGADDQHKGDELIRFVELLGASHIDVVGIVGRPPKGVAAAGQLSREVAIADILAQDPAVWSASLEPVMSRLALRVRWWQLGRDFDTSLIGLPKLNKKIEDVRTALFRFGQDVRLGMCSDWDSNDLHTGTVSWDFVQVAEPTPVTQAQFEQLLGRQRTNSAARWVVVDPPREEGFALTATPADCAACAPHNPLTLNGSFLMPAWIETGLDLPAQGLTARVARASAFVHQLVKAKLKGADAIIIAKPFNDENGLMRADGSPAELLLPWRTTAAMLSGAKHMGHLRLPNESPNEIFLRPDGQVVMIVWNKVPTREVLYLGNNVKQYDLFGRSISPPKNAHEQVIEVGPAPSFVVGLHEAVTRFRMNVKFEKNEVPSIFSQPHHNSLSFRNYFAQGVGGTVKIVVLQDQEMTPDLAAADATEPAVPPTAFAFDRWLIEPPQATFQLAANAETKFPFEIKLKTALYGRQPVRVDFTIEADERLQFSVYDAMEVGTDDLKLRVKSHLDKDGTLIVEQQMTNLTDRLADFKCYLRSKGYRPKRMQVYRLGREMDRKIYRFQDGAEMIGKEMLLEIEEVNGLRVLRYRFVAGEAPKEEDAAEDPEESKGIKRLRSEERPHPFAQVGS
ncbi:MAG: hypothetical protein U0805_10630 [Pirellulales bacterium]